VAWTSPCWLPVIEQLQETALAACSNPQQTDAVSSRCYKELHTLLISMISG
jgi:hypothetical protein